MRSVIFGDQLRPCADPAAAATLLGRARGALGTVGWLVPDHFEVVVRIEAPSSQIDDWNRAYRRLFQSVVEVGRGHTQVDTATFGVWEGHGFDVGVEQPYWTAPPAGDADAAARRRAADRLRATSDAANRQIRREMRGLPAVVHPGRRYLLVDGGLDDVSSIRWPHTGDWHHPDLLWPSSEAWFVATDVDLWALFVGGTHTLGADLASSLGSSVREVARDAFLEPEN